MSDDPRLGSIVRCVELDGNDDEKAAEALTASVHEGRATVAFVGFPHDEGVRRNGGRVGARHGPEVVRRFMQRMGTVINREFDVDLSNKLTVLDVGDVGVGCALEDAHVKLRRVVGLLMKAGIIPFVVGGGNDQSYPNAQGMMDAMGSTSPLSVINIDAHLDVRPLKSGQVHSGSPFRQLMEDERFGIGTRGRFIEFAAQGSQCGAQHIDYVREKGGSIVWLSDTLNPEFVEDDTGTKEFLSAARVVSSSPCLPSFVSTFLVPARARKECAFLSFDLDSVTGADAPGVSCVASVGISAQDALDICRVCGASDEVRLVDLSEYNPTIEEHRTGRLVANMFYQFLCGVAMRMV